MAAYETRVYPFTICKTHDKHKKFLLSIYDDNGIDDAEDIAAGAEDCNGDGQIDSCEIIDGAFDTNGNMRLDSCELDEGDLNLDGCVNGGDLGLFG